MQTDSKRAAGDAALSELSELSNHRNASMFAIRPIKSTDNAAVARLIRVVMPEFGADGPGFAICDPEVDDMASAYDHQRAQYFVVERQSEVLGAGGFAPLLGGDADICEVRKMYFYPQARGLGIGARLLELILTEARRAGFRQVYLETLTNMQAAQKLYVKKGFQRLNAPWGRTGHGGCDVWLARTL